MAAAFVAVSCAEASPVSIAYSGSGSGEINGAVFTDAAFVFSAVVDSSDWAPATMFSNAFTAVHVRASISIDGVGDYGLVTETHTFVQQDSGLIGLMAPRRGASPVSLVDLFSLQGGAEVKDWDRVSPLSVTSGDGELLQWSLVDVQTTGGLLRFAPGSSIAAAVGVTAVPEPAGLVLAAPLGLLATRRRRAA